MDKLGSLAKFIAILLMIAGVPGYKFLLDYTEDSILSIAIFVVYEFVVFVIGFISKVWQPLEEKWTGRIADKIDQLIQHIFSGYRRHYLTYITFQHRFFDVKGLRSQGPYNLELDKVFVELYVDPTPMHQISSNPIENLPENLRQGAHSIWEFLNDKRMSSQNLAILGAPGCGKTILLKYVALTLAAPLHRRKKNNAPSLFPILLFIRDHAKDIQADPNIKLSKLIRDQFERRKAPIPPDGWLENKILSGSCLIMLDGLDEVANLTMRSSVVDWVEQCMTAHGNNRFIITSRPHGYRNNPLANVTVLQVRPFTSVQVKQFVYNWYLANELMSSQRNDAGVRADAKLGADDLLKRLYNTPTLSEIAVNPLLLTMIANVHRYRSSLPGRRVELYAEICEVFLGKRQEARGMAVDLTPAQKQRVLQPLAYYMMQNHIREIKQCEIAPVIDEILLSVSPQLIYSDFIKDVENGSGLFVERESGEYYFSHLTFQEYLASVHFLVNHLEDALSKHVTDSWWEETIRLFSAQANASNIIEACLNVSTVSTLGLAIECMEEAREVSIQVRERFNKMIEEGLNSSDPERRHLIAEAHLKKRLK